MHALQAPMSMQDQYQPNGHFKKTKVAFCVHNIAYQVLSQLGTERALMPVLYTLGMYSNAVVSLHVCQLVSHYHLSMLICNA